MFQLNSNIKRKLLMKMLGRDISKLEYEVQNEINKLNLNNRNCSYQIILNNYSWEVLICSKRNVVIEDLKQLKDDYYIKYGFENLNKIFSDEESMAMGIYTFNFTEEDIMRSELVKFIVQKINKEGEQ